ncbi:MAG: DUF4347 domain-containing protein [Magnetococcales bacterium]|nr:DUF4347 domain-containing protein [Magnetococcales bacterium]
MQKLLGARGWGDGLGAAARSGAGHLFAPWLGMGPKDKPPPGRPRRLIIEPLEQRLLLSGEGLILPPPDPTLQTDPQSLITTPTELLNKQVTSTGSSDPIVVQPLDSAAKSVQPQADGRANEVVFVDGAVRERDALLETALADRLQQQPEARFEVVLLDSRSDGVRQITQWLQQHEGLNAIHILSHGEEAALWLGSARLDATTLEPHSADLTAWGNALQPEGDILLYGCNVAGGTAGHAFVERIGQLTRADVAASEDQTGASEWGGDWDLEFMLGAVQTELFAPADYHHLLAVVTPSKSGMTSASIASTATDAFSAAAKLGVQLDASADLAYTLPMVDLAFSGLIKTNDGRTLGDILSFKTPANTTVLDDYLAQSGTHTMGGLMNLLGDYLNGTGIYSNLESLVDHAAGSPAISFSATADALDVDLTLSRAFLQRFGFDEALRPLGFGFQPGQGIPLVADINYVASYNFTDGTVAITTLTAQVKAASSTLDVEAALGILDVTASGTIAFDTGQVEFTAISAVDAATLKVPGDSNYQNSDNQFSLLPSSTRDVKANLSFDLLGATGTAQAIMAGSTPHVNIAFGGLSLDSRSTPALLPTLTGTAILSSGQTLEVTVSGATYTVTPASDGTWSLDLASNPVPTTGALTPLAAGQTYVVTAKIKQAGLAKATVTGDLVIDSGLSSSIVTGLDTSAEKWEVIPQRPLVVTTSDFSAVQPFSSLDATEMVRMLQDLGTYLELLRDSGRFDAVLPFTNLKLSDALDFSAVINDVIDNQLATTLLAGVTASKAISPFLPSDTPLLPLFAGSAAFDLYVQRPGDDRTSVLTITVDANETSSFRHINQLAELLGRKIATAVNGWLAWSGSNFEVEESLKGGMTLAGTDKSSEEQILKVHAAAGTYQLRLGAGGTLTGPLSVLASPVEVQNALESVLGAGNVVVTGRPKHYQIQFTGSLANSNRASLEVVEGSDVVAGSLIDVTTSDLSRGSDGRIWGKINLLQANPGDFTLLRVAPSSAVKVTQLSAGSDDAEAMQRLTIIHGGGSSTFTLSGTDASGVAFTTGNIAATADAATIAAALFAKLPTVTGLSVADVSAEYASDNATRVFEIGFGKKNATQYGSYATLTVDTKTAGVWKSAIPAQGILATWQQAVAAVGSTPAKNEIQRLSLSNATGGDFAIGITLGGVLLQTTPIAFAGGAAAIQTALVSMFRQFEPTFSGSDCSVTAVAGKSNTYDIEFKGIWAAKDLPQMRLNTHGLTSASGNSYSPLTQLGMLADGQDMMVNSVTSFVTFTEMVERFQQAINATLPAGASFSLNPRYDVATKSLLFDCKLAPAATLQPVPLTLAGNVGDLSALSADTMLDLSTETLFQSTIGFDFAHLNTFGLRAGGAYVGTLVAKAQDATLTGWSSALPLIGGNANFSLLFDGEQYDLTLTQASTTDNASRADLVADFQAVLDAKAVISGGVLGQLGFAKLGELVTAGVNTAGQLQFSVKAPLSEVKLAINTLNAMNTLLGFKNLMLTYPTPKAVTLATNGQLSAAATFKLAFDQTDGVTVTVAPDASNTQTSDLVDDLNAAFAATSVASHAYLGSGGMGFANLGEVVKAILRNKQIEIVTLSAGLASLQIQIDGVDPAMTELGFTPGQHANTSGAYVFLQDAVIGGSYSAVIHGQSGATPGTLASPAQATLGMLNLTADRLWTDLQGSMQLELRNGLAGVAGDRISLNALFDSVSSQESLLGLGGALQTSNTVSATSVPYLSNGQLLRDVGLLVTVGSIHLDVTVLRSATLNNSSVTELAANVDDAIHAALVAKLGSDPYASHTFVSLSNIGTVAVPKNVLTFTAPTTTLTLDANPTQIYDAATGVLLTDLRLAVAVGGLAQPVDVVVRTSRTSTNQSLAELVTDVAESIKMALSSAKSNTTDDAVKANLDALIASTDLVGLSGSTLTLKAGVVTAKEIVLKFLAVKGRLMEGDYVTDPLFLDQAGTAGSTPKATLKLSGINVVTPTGISATGLVPTTEITIDVSNTVAMLKGTDAMTTVTVVPSNGLGTLTPFKGVTWSSLKADLSQLTGVLGDLGALGSFGELGRALPMLGSSVSSLFDFTSRFKQITAQLTGQQGVGLLELQGILATAFGIDASAISLENDNTVGQEALRIVIPYRVVLNQALPVDLIFNDSALLGLLSAADRDELMGLIGSLREVKDTEGTAKCQFYADMTFNLALGIDLSSGSNQGKLFLYDHVAGGAAGLAGDQGTFARLDTFSATAAGITFQSNQGIYSLGVSNGTADLTLTGSGVMLHSDAADGANDGRLYLGAYGSLSATDATALKKSNFEVIFDGSSSVVFPLVLSVSDELGQLAMEQIDGFINPLPLGKMELHFLHLGETFAKMGGKSGYTLQDTAEATDSALILSSQVRQAALPERPSTGNGIAATTPEGAPVDDDNEAALDAVTLDPFYASTAGQGASTTPSTQTLDATVLFSATPQANPSSAGFDISLIIPDLEFWQLELTVVLEHALGAQCDPDKPVNGPLMFLLRDPTIVVNTVDKVLGTIQKGLDAFSDVLSLPIIGDQLREATQFVADLRINVVKALSDALTASVDIYGGLDNALRMFLFDMLTTDTNHDFIIQATEISSNPFLNFLQDYNGDNLVTPDDIVVEYIAGVGAPRIDPALADYLGITQPSMIPAVLPGQRTAWVTAGQNLPNLDSHGDPILHDDGTPCYIGDAGDVIIDSSLRHILDDIAGSIDSMAETASSLMSVVQSTGQDKSFFDSLQNIVTFIANKVADGYNYQSLLRDVFGAGVTAAVLTDVMTTFTPSALALKSDLLATQQARLTDPNAVVVTASLAELKAAVKEEAIKVGTQVALAQSTAIQFRMHLGQTYTPQLDLSFDIGVPGLPLSLELDGGIALELDWDLYLGFGIDIKDGFYLVTNMPATAGLGEITSYDPNQPGIATGVVSNHHDVHIDNLWLVGKPTFTPAVKEIQAQINVYLAPGASGQPTELNAQLFVLNGTLTDNWDGWIRDNDTGIWGSGSDSMGRLVGAQSANYGRTTTLFDGDSGADGSRTRLQLNLAVDLKDKGLFGISALSGLTNGRLTFNDLRTAKLSDLVAVEWDAKAQVNLHMELGISLGGEGYLPKIMGDFHMTWQESNKNQYVQKIEQFFSTGYDTLFHAGAPNIWMTDIYLDAGTFFTNFLNPIVSLIQDVTDPIMPVIDALTTPIPGLSDIMGRDYSVVDLASDMSAMFGGISQIDFIVAMVNLLDVIDNLPTNTAGMLIPVTQAFVVSGTKDRKLNLSALPEIPGLSNLDVPVDLPYEELANIAVNQDGLEFSLNMGVGWQQDTTLLTIFKGDMPDLGFDFALSADVKVPAPYIDVTPVDFTIDGLTGTFRLNIKAGWQDLRLSDILTGGFVPHFDVTVELPTGFDINTQVLPVLQILMPKMTWQVGTRTWEWAAGETCTVDWPAALSSFVDPATIKTIDLTGASFNVNLGSIAPFLPQIQVKWPTVHWIGLGKEFIWKQTQSTNLGWSSIISDAGLLAALVDPGRTITVDMPDVWLPSISLLDLLPDIDFSFGFGLPALPSLPDINIDLPDIDMPGQQTVSPQQAFTDFQNRLNKPGSALAFPILEDPIGSVIALLTGEPADLVTYTPGALRLGVGFRVSFPVYPPLYVGIGGNIDVNMMFNFGYDTYGISKFFDSHNLIDMLDGFYIGDNIVNGVDKPEVTLTAKLFAFAELNAVIVRGGVEGGIKLEGTLDIYDEDKDNKYRASELIAAVSEDPLDVVEMHLRGSAYISAYVDLNLLVEWVRVYEWTFMDVTLFEWEHDPAAKKPVLASMDGSVLTLHTGSTIGSIDGNSSVDKDAGDRLRRSIDDGNESYTLTGSNGTVNIEALLPNGQTYTKTFVGVTRVKAYTGAGDDTLDASALDLPVLFIAGGGTDILKGGSADDILIGSDSGNATLIGGGGNDLLLARGGTTLMQGGTGSDRYRFLGEWGTATIEDIIGDNELDFSAQTAAINVDDAYYNATRANNQATWDGTTTIDVVKGGSGSDWIDFSGDAANLLITVTATDAGWVKGAASGMTQTAFDATTHQDMVAAGDNAGRGFKFIGFENVVGGQGSDVFRIRDGASLTGSMAGDTANGAWHDASGNEAANARNTIDFSEYTSAVRVDLEAASAFGTAGATSITVRGFHNVFGGSAGDRLSGDGRNNMIVGNNGTDFIEGKAAHDLLVADTFVTYKNLLSGQTRPASGLQNVTDYLTLQAAGAAEFGAASRNWIWKGQTLENISLSVAGKQTLKGGSGNDMIFGALGGDLINVGGSGEGNDTIMADLGKVEVDFNYRTALSATTFGSRGGGGDTIYLGSGSNLVLAGSGRDTITGADLATSNNIILADNGTVQFRTEEATVAGQTKLTFKTTAGRSHLLDYILAPVSETGGLGNDDVVNLSSGSGIVFGGSGNDTIYFNAASSTGGNSRFIAGDHGRIDTDVNGGAISFKSLDLLGSDGGNDRIVVGNQNDLVARYLGSNYIIAGVGSDTVLVSASQDATTGVITSGAANSTDVILGDNGEISRWDSVASTDFNLLKQVSSSELDVGGADVIHTANGDKVIVGGEGQDSITVNTTSQSKRYISGDNVTLTYDTTGGLTDLVTTDTALTDSGAGDADLITIGLTTSSDNLGVNLISGGMGGDTIQVLGATTSFDTILADNGEIHRNAGAVATAYALRDVHSTLLTLGGNDTIRTANGDKVIVGGEGQDSITVDTSSQSKRHISGDNVTLTYDTAGGLTDLVTTDTASTDSGAGDVDLITIGQAGSSANLGENLISGGMGGDTIQVLGVTTSFDTILADNGEIHRNAGTLATAYALRDVHSTLLNLGGNDTVRTANGDKVIVGGFGRDVITIETTSLSKRHISGDNVQMTYDTTGGLTDLVTTDTVATTGDNDTIIIGVDQSKAILGENLVAGGMGNDLLKVFDTISSDDKLTTSSEDVLIGDNGAIHRTSATASSLYRNRMLQIVSTVTDKGGNDTIITGSGGKVIIGGFGTDVISAVDGDHMVIGDNGVLNFDTDAKNGIIRQMESIDTVIGGDDTITLREGYKVVIGGYGADTVTVFGGFLAGAGVPNAVGVRDVTGIDASAADAIDLPAEAGIDPQVRDLYRLAKSIASARSLANVTTVAQQIIDIHRQLISTTGIAQEVLDVYQQAKQVIDIYRKGHSGRYVSGDNVRVVFDAKGSLTTITSTDAIAATGGADTITLGARDFTGNLGYQVVIGGMAADKVLVRTDTTSEDVIFGDNAEYKRHSLNYEHLLLTSLVPEQGDGDTILSGKGKKIVVGGFGGDTVLLNTLNDSDSSTVLGDSGQLNFSVAGSGLVEKIESLALGFGGGDTVTIGDGEVTFIGGFAGDKLAVNSTRTARRMGVGDNATLLFGVDSAGRAALTNLTTTDQNASTGGSDSINIGPTGSITGNMGETLLVGGMSTDTLIISGVTATATLVGDNVDLRRTTAGRLLTLSSLLPDQGGGDLLQTVSGNHVIVGGMGGDVITAGSGVGTVTGDSATLVFDVGGSGVLKTASSLGLAVGGNDTISLGTGGATSDGHKVVIGGYGADTITVLSVHGAATNINERSVAGDNASLFFDNEGRLTNFSTLDADVSTGGADTITLIMSGDAPTGNPLTDFNVVAGGMADDSINVIGATRSQDIISGDNLDYRRAKDGAGTYQHLFADVVQPRTGGADTIRTGSGDKLVFGGAGADRITTLTVEGDRNLVFGDAGSIVFETAVTGKLGQLFSTAETAGGTDVLVVGGGESYLIGGLGKDSLTFNTADTGNRIAVGDNGQINFTNGVASRVQSTDVGTVDDLAAIDTFMLSAFGTTLVLGGPGVDLKSGGHAGSDEILPGSGTITVASRIVSVVALGEYEEMGVTDFVRVKQPAGAGGAGGSGTSEIPLVLAGVGTAKEDTTLSASGRLTYPALDGGLATFVTGTSAGGYGSLTMGDDGSWSYQLDNSSATVQLLNSSDSKTDLFVVQTTDGSRSTVSITVQGTDDPVVISGSSQGTVTEDGTTQYSGQVVATDAGGGAVTFQSATQAGTYGQLALATSGLWSYTLSNSSEAVQKLGAGQTVSDAFTVAVADGQTTRLVVTVQGSNDLPVVSGVSTGAVHKDTSPTASGQLTIVDVDSGESSFQAGSVSSQYGTLTLTAAGAWSYTLANNDAVKAMGSQDAVTDKLLVHAADGTDVTLTLSVTGNGVSSVTSSTGTTTTTTTGTTATEAATGTASTTSSSGTTSAAVTTGTTVVDAVVAAAVSNTANTTTTATGSGSGQGNTPAGNATTSQSSSGGAAGAAGGGVPNNGSSAASTTNGSFAQLLGSSNVPATGGVGGTITPMSGLGGSGPGAVSTNMTVGDSGLMGSGATSNPAATGSIIPLGGPQLSPSAVNDNRGVANSLSTPLGQTQTAPVDAGQSSAPTTGANPPAATGQGQNAAPASDNVGGALGNQNQPAAVGPGAAPANAGGVDTGGAAAPGGAGAAPAQNAGEAGAAAGPEGGAASPEGGNATPPAQDGGEGEAPNQGAAADMPGLFETAGAMMAAAAGRIQWQQQNKTGDSNRRNRPLFDWGS